MIGSTVKNGNGRLRKGNRRRRRIIFYRGDEEGGVSLLKV